MRRLKALSSLTRPAWLVSQICVITPGPSRTGNSTLLPGGKIVISKLASFHLGCSLLETRRFRPGERVTNPARGSANVDWRAVGADEAEAWVGTAGARDA